MVGLALHKRNEDYVSYVNRQPHLCKGQHTYKKNQSKMRGFKFHRGRWAPYHSPFMQALVLAHQAGLHTCPSRLRKWPCLESWSQLCNQIQRTWIRNGRVSVSLSFLTRAPGVKKNTPCYLLSPIVDVRFDTPTEAQNVGFRPGHLAVFA